MTNGVKERLVDRRGRGIAGGDDRGLLRAALARLLLARGLLRLLDGRLDDDLLDRRLDFDAGELGGERGLHLHSLLRGQLVGGRVGHQIRLLGVGVGRQLPARLLHVRALRGHPSLPLHEDQLDHLVGRNAEIGEGLLGCHDDLGGRRVQPEVVADFAHGAADRLLGTHLLPEVLRVATLAVRRDEKLRDLRRRPLGLLRRLALRPRLQLEDVLRLREEPLRDEEHLGLVDLDRGLALADLALGDDRDRDLLALVVGERLELLHPPGLTVDDGVVGHAVLLGLVERFERSPLVPEGGSDVLEDRDPQALHLRHEPLGPRLARARRRLLVGGHRTNGDGDGLGDRHVLEQAVEEALALLFLLLGSLGLRLRLGSLGLGLGLGGLGLLLDLRALLGAHASLDELGLDLGDLDLPVLPCGEEREVHRGPETACEDRLPGRLVPGLAIELLVAVHPDELLDVELVTLGDDHADQDVGEWVSDVRRRRLVAREGPALFVHDRHPELQHAAELDARLLAHRPALLQGHDGVERVVDRVVLALELHDARLRLLDRHLVLDHGNPPCGV